MTLKAPAYQIYSTENIWDGYLLKIMIHSCSCTKTFAKKIVESQDLFCFCPKLIFLLLELQDCSRRSDVFCGNPSNYVILASDVSILRCRHINNTQYHQNTALLHVHLFYLSYEDMMIKYISIFFILNISKKSFKDTMV